MPAWPISPYRCAGAKGALPPARFEGRSDDKRRRPRRLFSFKTTDLGGLFELVGEGVASTAHSAHRIGLRPSHHRLAQAADMHIDGALIDIDVAAPHAVQELGAAEHAAGALHQEL